MQSDSIKYRAYPVNPGDVATLDGVTTGFSVIIPFDGMKALGILETFDGTLAATLTLEMSMNYDRRNPTAARWTSVTDAAIAAFLATDVATPGGGKPSGAPGNAALTIGSENVACAAFRWTVARTAGSGNYYLDVNVHIR